MATILNETWLPPPKTWELGDQEIHVWRASLDSESSRIQRFENLLSADERERVSRFRFAKDRERFIIARGLLRTILGCYLREEPDKLQFRYTCVCGDPQCQVTLRKPALAMELSKDALQYLSF